MEYLLCFTISFVLGFGWGYTCLLNRWGNTTFFLGIVCTSLIAFIIMMMFEPYS